MLLRLSIESAKSVVETGCAWYCRRRYRPSRVAVICPPIPADNLGDQAMILGAVAELSRRGVKDPILVASGPRFGIGDQIPTPFTLADRHQFFGSDRAFREGCALLRDFARSRQLVVFGADVLDGHYGQARYARTFAAIERAVRMGTRVRIIGFSVSREPDSGAVHFFRQYSDRVELYPRDPVTLRRLQDAGAGNLTLAADAAFLMEPAVESSMPDSTRMFADHHDGRLIGISLHANFFDRDPDRLLRYMLEVLIELSRRESFGFLFVPHHPKDLQYQQQIVELGPAAFRSRCHLVGELPTAPVAKRMISRCRHVVTSRMHVAIAALSTCTPVTCFPYLGKFEGLFEHFELTDGLIDAGRLPVAAADLAATLAVRVSDGDAMRATIAARLPAVVQLAHSNFDFA